VKGTAYELDKLPADNTYRSRLRRCGAAFTEEWLLLRWKLQRLFDELPKET